MNTMLALVADTPGPPEVLELRRVAIPEPGPGEVRIRVAYATLNPLDTHARAARVAYMAPDFPFTPGIEFSGLVEAVGAGVDPAWIGRRVVSERHWGGCAELAVTAADALIEIPDGFDWVLGTVFHTCVYSSWHVLHTAGRIRSGDTVLLHSAAGAIGAMSAQIAKEAGADVVGLCAPAKFHFARSFGFDHLVDSRAPDWVEQVVAATAGRGADLVIDGVAGPEAPKNFAALAPLGQVIYIGAVGGYAPPVDISRELYAKSIAVRGFMVYVAAAATGGIEKEGIHDALRSGRWRAPVSRIAGLDEAVEMHRLFERRELFGRNLFRVGGELESGAFGEPCPHPGHQPAPAHHVEDEGRQRRRAEAAAVDLDQALFGPDPDRRARPRRRHRLRAGDHRQPEVDAVAGEDPGEGAPEHCADAPRLHGQRHVLARRPAAEVVAHHQDGVAAEPVAQGRVEAVEEVVLHPLRIVDVEEGSRVEDVGVDVVGVDYHRSAFDDHVATSPTTCAGSTISPATAAAAATQALAR